MKVKIKDVLMINPDHATQTSNIFIENDKIVHIGVNAPKDFRADYLIDGRDKLAVPGFVNTHTHAYMSVFRNWADEITHQDWIYKLRAIESKFTPDDAYPMCLLSILEMLQSGITCFVDMHMFTEASITAARDVNVTSVVSKGLCSGKSGSGDSKRRLDVAIEEYEKFKDLPYCHFMLAPYSASTCSIPYLELISDTARKYDLGIHTHLAHSKMEVAECKSKHKMHPVKIMNELGLLSEKTIACGCTNVNEDDIKILADSNVNVSLNTCSDLKFGNGIAPSVLMDNYNINLCIGTDGAASNNSLNMLKEMQITSLIKKGQLEDPYVMDAHSVFDMVTINGAKAVGLETQIGKLEKGYNADVVLFDLNDLSFIPLNDPISALCYSAAGITAHTVICNGKIVIYNKEFIDIDMPKLKDHVMQAVVDNL